MQGLTTLGLMVAGILLSGCLASRPSVWERIGAHTWSLIRIEGQPPLPDSRVTLHIEDPNRLFGESGVNRYFGSFEEIGETGFRASQIAGTRMAGPLLVMDQETRFLDLLGRADSVRLGEEEGEPLLELLENERPLLAFHAAR